MSTYSSDIPEIKLDPRIYDEQTAELMRVRGMLQDGEGVEEALNRTIHSVCETDAYLMGKEEVDGSFLDRVRHFTSKGIFVFGTPVLTGAGVEGRVTAACTVIHLSTESGQVVNDRFYNESKAALDNAIGTGYDLSGVEDPVFALSVLNKTLDGINTDLVERHKRPVASMATLRADHPEILNFVSAKREADFSEWRLNISVFVTEELFDRAARGELWTLRDSQGAQAGHIEAADLLDAIADSAHYCGEPGILFKDRIDDDNPTPQWQYESTAPCAEVAMAAGEACQFSYINLGLLTATDISSGEVTFDQDLFTEAVRDMTRVLDAVVEQTIQNQSDISLPLVEQKRRIGIGITGFADLLVRLRIPYDDPRAIKLSGHISELLDYYTKRSSVELAKKRGAFPAFDESRFRDREWLARKMHNATGAVELSAWEELFEDIQTHGLRHASTTSLPPTGTSSTMVKSSKSLEPHFMLTAGEGVVYPSVEDTLANEEDQQLAVHVGGLIVSSVVDLPADIIEKLPYLKTARQISPRDHLRAQAAFQSFLDESLAKTVNLPEGSTVSDVRDILNDAYGLGLKGITVFRDNCLAQRSAAAP